MRNLGKGGWILLIVVLPLISAVAEHADHERLRDGDGDQPGTPPR